eukprot:gene3634-biopygen21372
MKERHNIIFQGANDILRIRQKLFMFMQGVEKRSDSDSLSLRDKNNIALNLMRDMMKMDEEEIPPTSKSCIENKSNNDPIFIRRERDVLQQQSRPRLPGLEDAPPRPQSTLSRFCAEDRDTVMANFVDSSSSYNTTSRSNTNDDGPDLRWDGEEVPHISNEEFDRRVEDLVRDRLTCTSVTAAPDHNVNDHNLTDHNLTDHNLTDHNLTDHAFALPSSALLPSVTHHVGDVYWSVGLNGVDRDVEAHPHGFRFGSRVTGFGCEDFRGISWISVSSAIVPMEKRASSARPYINDYDFSYPYVLVNLEGFDGMYNGSSEAIRRSFCMLVFDRSFRAANGRGYVMLKPVSERGRKTFDTHLASLRSLGGLITRPSGVLFNNSVDALRLTSLSYETQYGLYIRIVCNRFFDMNEFVVGDDVRFSEFDGRPASASGAEDDMSLILQANAYINHEEGHEVVRLGGPNAQVFSNSFYILAPGFYNSVEGTLVLHEQMLEAIRAMALFDAFVRPGAIVNQSLLAFLTLNIGCVPRVYSATRNIGVSAVVSTLFIFLGTVAEAPLKTLVRRGYRIEFRQPWILVATAKS